jgi:hypothetical protein
MHWNGASWKRISAPSPSGGYLSAVSASSASNVWAVGSYGTDETKTLIMHWNGTAWKQMPAPKLKSASGNAVAQLTSVSVVSANNAWAAGDLFVGGSSKGSVVLHWNGKAWTEVPVPVPAYGTSGGELAAAGNTAWVTAMECLVGCTKPSEKILRWTGTAWKVSVILTGHQNLIEALAATSPVNAWAVGSAGSETLILHWNGKAWS